MSVKRSIWISLFDQSSFPGLPCPQCEPGKLKLVSNSLKMEEPSFSATARKDPDWDPEWITNRFQARLKCDEKHCGEIVSVAGETETVQTEFDEDDGFSGWGLQEVLSLKSVFPAPPLFKISDNTPNGVKKQLRLAFQFFWSDYSTSAGRLRTAVELMLDSQKIPKEKLTKKGKTMRMDLAERIEFFASSATGSDAKEALHGLRYVGNLGTHGSEVSKEALFDACDVLEDVLLGVYEKKSINAKVKKLKDTKGEY